MLPYFDIVDAVVPPWLGDAVAWAAGTAALELSEIVTKGTTVVSAKVELAFNAALDVVFGDGNPAASDSGMSDSASGSGSSSASAGDATGDAAGTDAATDARDDVDVVVDAGASGGSAVNAGNAAAADAVDGDAGSVVGDGGGNGDSGAGGKGSSDKSNLDVGAGDDGSDES